MVPRNSTLAELIAVRREGLFSRTPCGFVLERCICMLNGFRRVSGVIGVRLIEEGSSARSPLVKIFQDHSTLQYVLKPFTTANIGHLYCTVITRPFVPEIWVHFQRCKVVSSPRRIASTSFFSKASHSLSSLTRRRFYPQRPSSGQAVVTGVVPSSPVRAFTFCRA